MSLGMRDYSVKWSKPLAMRLPRSHLPQSAECRQADRPIIELLYKNARASGCGQREAYSSGKGGIKSASFLLSFFLQLAAISRPSRRVGMMTGQKWGMLIVFVEEEENMQGGSDGRSSVHGQVHLKESVGYRRCGLQMDLPPFAKSVWCTNVLSKAR